MRVLTCDLLDEGRLVLLMVANRPYLSSFHLHNVRILGSLGVNSRLLAHGRRLLLVRCKVVAGGECIHRVVGVVRGILTQLVLVNRLLDIRGSCASAADLMVTAVRAVGLQLGDTGRVLGLDERANERLAGVPLVEVALLGGRTPLGVEDTLPRISLWAALSRNFTLHRGFQDALASILLVLAVLSLVTDRTWLDYSTLVALGQRIVVLLGVLLLVMS